MEFSSTTAFYYRSKGVKKVAVALNASRRIAAQDEVREEGRENTNESHKGRIRCC